MKEEREEGFYWIFVDGEWEIAEWQKWGGSGDWAVCGSDEGVFDIPTKVGERLIPPKE